MQYYYPLLKDSEALNNFFFFLIGCNKFNSYESSTTSTGIAGHGSNWSPSYLPCPGSQWGGVCVTGREGAGGRGRGTGQHSGQETENSEGIGERKGVQKISNI